MVSAAGSEHNLDLNLGISPSLDDGPRENEGHLQFHLGPYDMDRKSLRVTFDLRIFEYQWSMLYFSYIVHRVLEHSFLY